MGYYISSSQENIATGPLKMVVVTWSDDSNFPTVFIKLHEERKNNIASYFRPMKTNPKKNKQNLPNNMADK